MGLAPLHFIHGEIGFVVIQCRRPLVGFLLAGLYLQLHNEPIGKMGIPVHTEEEEEASDNKPITSSTLIRMSISYRLASGGRE